jgi:UDP-N-acetylmuramoylalanine--D-glutamate ligase
VAVSIGKVLGRGIFAIHGRLFDAWDQPAAAVGDLALATRLPGAHNWQNAALAYAAVKRIVRDARAIMTAITRFPGLAHRIEEVGRIGKVRFINDSKATNADAAARALACYSDIFWIAGGKPKEGGISDLAPYFPKLRRAYLIGEAAEGFGRTLQGKVDAVQSGTLESALKTAFEDARFGDAAEPVVLLSPACASFDQFRDFEQRGDMFRDMVNSMVMDSQNSPTREAAAS